MEIDVRTIENLRNYYAPKPDVVTKLPDPKSCVDGQQAVLKDDTTYTLYILVGGAWKKVATLT